MYIYTKCIHTSIHIYIYIYIYQCINALSVWHLRAASAPRRRNPRPGAGRPRGSPPGRWTHRPSINTTFTIITSSIITTIVNSIIIDSSSISCVTSIASIITSM